MKQLFFTLVIALSAIFMPSLHAQVTIGSGDAPARAALLQLKTKQEAGAVSSVSDTKNATSTEGGFLLPRVELVSIATLEPFIANNDPEFVNNTNSLKEKLAGLMVYNIKYLQVAGIDILYPGVYTWDGAKWVTSQANDAPFMITDQPRPFTFYENITLVPIPSGEEKLRFGISGRIPDDIGVNAFSYQWFMLTGTNVHVRVGEKIGSAVLTRNLVNEINVPSITAPIPIISGDGDTRYANNNGFYKLYCEATELATGRKLVSDIAEVAVGCGAKNNLGDWISFMCFNLGAEKSSTIATQKNTAYTGTVQNQQDIYGSLFQWGRIADGHEKRNSGTVAYGAISEANDIADGYVCNSSELIYGHPWRQVKKTSIWYGKFILGGTIWNPTSSANSDMLWRTGRFTQNDPCSRYNVDGTYLDFWYDGTAATNAACGNSNNGYGSTTNWRTPSQADWGEIYKGGMLLGTSTQATANTWAWNSTNGQGYEIQPNGATTTLFLPANGFRSSSLSDQGVTGRYWSTSVYTTSAYYLFLANTQVNPIGSQVRSLGFALRCIKN